MDQASKMVVVAVKSRALSAALESLLTSSLGVRLITLSGDDCSLTTVVDQHHPDLLLIAPDFLDHDLLHTLESVRESYPEVRGLILVDQVSTYQEIQAVGDWSTAMIGWPPVRLLAVIRELLFQEELSELD